jgi:SAM-dependent methyltransferase
MITRQEKILSCIDLENQLGIEIGPLNKPIVTREMGNIRYVDHASTEDLKQKYAGDSNVDVDAIVDVDYVWGEKTLPELVADEAPFDYVIASHVIEHVPDFIGWLKEIHAVLKPGGILSLAIPDKRYCFDYCRYLTKPAEIIEAYLEGRRKPSPRQIFDHFSSCVSLNGVITWTGAIQESDLIRLYTDEQALDLAKHSIASREYVDAHCWVFTPDSFFKLIKNLISIDLFSFRVARFYPTTGCEFYVTLEALDLAQDENERQQIQLESLSSFALKDLELENLELKKSEPELALENEILSLNSKLKNEQNYAQAIQKKLAELQKRSKQTQHKLENLQTDKQRLRKKVQILQSDLDSQHKEVAAMQSSKFWKLRVLWIRLKQSLGLEE